MNQTKARYNRSFRFASFVRVAVFGAILTAIGCGFVHVKTQRVTKGNSKGDLERQIDTLRKEIRALEAQMGAAVEREAIRRRLLVQGTELVGIEHHLTLVGEPSPSGQVVARQQSRHDRTAIH